MEHHRPFIQLDKVSKSFGDDPTDVRFQVLHEVSLTIEEGEFLMLFGPSGSGKSTILNLVAGLEGPSTGRVLFHGRDLSHYDTEHLARFHRLRMGMVFQNFNLIKSLNCWENVALPLAAGGMRYVRRKKRALELMEQLGIVEYANRFPGEISGGEQQRLAIARALANKPDLILADEPTGNLDTKTANEVMEILQAIHKDFGVTIIMVTHNPAYLPQSTRYLNIEDGNVIKEVGSPERLKEMAV